MISQYKEALIQKFIECFSKNGIENTSIRDLCSYAKVSSSVVYGIFGSKEEIVFNCGAEIVNMLMTRLRKYTEMYADNIVLLCEFYFNTFKELRKEVCFYIQILTSPNPAYSQIGKIYPDMRKWADEIAGVLNINKDNFEPIFRQFISVSFFYCITGDEESAKIQRYALYDIISEEIHKQKAIPRID